MSNLNHTFRIIWNHSLQVWQAVAETASGQGKSKSAKSALTPSRGAALALAGALTLGLVHAGDLPLGGQVVGGQASVQSTGAVMTVRQTTANLAMDWQSFNIGKGNTVNFVQPSAQATALNRVLGSDVSLIQGALNANGKLFLVNPNGIVFTPTAQVNVGSLVASTLNVSPSDFMAGNYRFEGDSAASVVNQGQIRVANGGAVALIAAQIVNTGDITAPGGSIAMGAGRKVRLDMGGATLLEVEEGALNALIEQGGALKANDGRVYLSARAARDLVGSVINQNGLIEANSISGLGGLVALEADTIALAAGSRISATGALGGGQVLVGGEWQGSGTLRQATRVSMEKGASIDASATQQGNGGQVVLWSDVGRSDSVTAVSGRILAKGAGAGGHGGQVETSGHQIDIENARVNAGSPAGLPGEWLIDPYNYTISDSQAAAIVGDANSGLNSGTSVTVDTAVNSVAQGSSGNSANAGDIKVSAAILKTLGGEATLTLKAARNIVLESGASFGSESGKLNLHFWADSGNTGVGINMVSAASIATNGGWLKFGNNQTATIGGSTLLVGGDVYFNGSTAQTMSTAGGAIDVYGETILANTSGLTITTSGGNVGFHGLLNSGNEYSWVDRTAGTYASNNWNWARTDAKNSTAGGAATGDSYLVTINSRFENAIASITSGYVSAWIGAWRANPSSSFVWSWADGPEAGKTFFTQGVGTSAGYYSNFRPGEPNGGLGGESVGQFVGTDGGWNDLPTTVQFSSEGIRGYVRETNLAASPLTINTGAGSLVINGGVGGNKALASLNVTAASTAVNGTALVTTGAQAFNVGPTVISAGNLQVGASSLSVGSLGSPILFQAAGQVTIAGVNVMTNGGDITLNSNAAGATSGGIYVQNNSVLDSRTSADRTAGTNTTGGGAITLGGGADPLTGYAQNVSGTPAGLLLGSWEAEALVKGHDANIDLKSGGGDITVNGKSTQQYLDLSLGVMAWEGVNIDAGTAGNITIKGLATGSTLYSWGLDIQAYRNALIVAPSTYQTVNGNITITGTGTGGSGDGGISFLAASSASALTLKATGAGSITLNGITDGAGEQDFRFANANVLAKSGAITLNGNRAGSLLSVINGTTNIGSLAGSGIETSSSDITLNVDKLNIVGPLNINTSGALTVQPYSTSFSSALTWPATNVTVSSDLTGLTLGKAGNTADITIGSATSIAGPISIYGGNINLSANLTSTLSGAAILAKASGNIVQAANVAVTTSNGAVTYWADSDNSGQGYIALNAGSSVGTTGGKIVMAGGLDDGGTNAGLTGLTANDGTPDGYAKTNAASATENAVDSAGVSVGLAGNTGSSVNLLSGGGDIVIRGQGGAASMGVTSQGTFKIDSGTGRVDMQGKSMGTWGIHFGWLGAPNWAISSANTTANAITVAGEGGLLLGNVYSGNMLIQATGAGGGVNLSGVSPSPGAPFGIFIARAGATTQILAQSGPINITGFKSGTVNDFISGGSLYLGSRKNDTPINGVTPLVTGSSANITFNVDSFDLANSTTNLSSTGTLTVQPYSTSFDSAQTWGVTPTSTFTGLQLGKLGNTADITIGSATSIAGPINIYGGNIAINAALNATDTNIISLTASGTVTDGASGYVVADKLALLGGNVTLDNASNSIGTLAASGVSGLTYVDRNALTIGSVGGTAGITATGPISVSTQVDDLTISQNISTANATSSAIVLNAGANAAAGTPEGGDIVVTGTPTLTVGDGGRATLYTGSISGSTGLAGLVESGHARYNADESNATGFTTALADGTFAIYREQPLVSLVIDAQTSTYGDELPALTGTLTGSTFNGDRVSYSLVGVTNSSTGKAKVGTYNIVESSLTGLGYGVNVTQAGSLTVRPKVLSASGITIADKVYDGTTLAVLSQNSTVSPIEGDQVSLSTTADFTTKNAGLNKSVNVSYVITGIDGGNYAATSLTNVATTAKISAKAITLSGLSSDHKVYDGTTQAPVIGTTSLGSQAVGSGTVVDGKVYAGDDIVLTGPPVANFATLNVGQSMVVSFTGLSLSGEHANNYTLTPHATTQKNITPRTVTVTADNKTKTFGEGDPAFTYKVTMGEVVTGDSLGGLLVRAPGSVAGAYAIDPTGLYNTNYSLSYVDGLLTIAPAPMAVSNGTNALAAPALPATPSMLVASLPLLDRSAGLVLIPLSPSQLEKATALNEQDSGGAEAPGQLMKTASSMGFTGLLVVDGGVSLPADAGLQQGK